MAASSGADPDRMLCESLEDTYHATKKQARVVGRVIATLVSPWLAGTQYDPMVPVKAVLGRWRGTGGDGNSDLLEFRDNFTYRHVAKGGETSGVFVAGVEPEGYVVALCDMNGDAEELHLSTVSKIARLGRRRFAPLAPAPTKYRTLLESALSGDLGDIAKHLDNGEDVNWLYRIDHQSLTVLHFVAVSGTETLADALLSAGADPNVKDHDGRSAFGSAVFAGRAAMVELLLKHGANVNEPLDRGNTPLHVALINKRLDIALILIRHGANPDARNQDGITPRRMAPASLLLSQRT